MYMMSKDRLTLELDELSLELVLRVLSSETPGADMDPLPLKEYENAQRKIHSVLEGFHQNGKLQQTNMLPDDVTVRLAIGFFCVFAHMVSCNRNAFCTLVH